ncbi:RND transporter [Thermaurantimonas aggregans]|uniref:RND transporter n=1 Tax=Thermaurantimonas aggregans TaxID=2173829 RepID=A0A401XNV5_9FLAO|nr:TolC family protein [Thermaurantimonas aggregans]MCX8149563.1 TolC family protein [Thermaurantimonas aggregans]GCD78697.1 RND transporter [Thermaurantimonas aggregans]
MKKLFKTAPLIIIALLVLISGCMPYKDAFKAPHPILPNSFGRSSADSADVASLSWRNYFGDPHLIALIDTALKNNQELNIVMQEIEVAKNEVRARKGEYLPFVNIGLGSGLEKEGLYTRKGAIDSQLSIKDGKPFPEPLGDVNVAALARWELDVWQKLRNAKRSAAMRYLSTIEGRNFLVTHLVAEIAEAYYELEALDNLLEIVEQNIEIQENALKVVRQQKDAAKVTQLAVNRFEAQLLNTRNLQYEIRQKITETENKINFLTGRYAGRVSRSSTSFLQEKIDSIQAGVPAQLLQNRPDIRQAEYELQAAKLDVKSARANFYPSVGIRAATGFQAFNPAFLLNPESILYNAAGDILAPFINRNAIKALYNTANAKQLQAVYRYEQTVLNAYVDVLNQLAKLENYSNSYQTKEKEVEILNHSVQIANSLFNSARADYAEVLLTQREALEARLDLIEVKLKLLQGKVNIYRALGGGWR